MAASCSIQRSVGVLGERWTLLIVRDALLGVTRFSDFKAKLGIASDVLTTRLASLVDAGVLERAAYREEGSRERTEYHLTDAGIQLAVVLGALSDWGRGHVDADDDSPTRFVDRTTGEVVHVAFVDGSGHALPLTATELRRDAV